jgi:hypothetical protein
MENRAAVHDRRRRASRWVKDGYARVAGTRLACLNDHLRHTALLAILLIARLAHAAPTLVVRAGDASPFGLPLSQFSDPALDDHGRVTFVAGSTVLFTRVGSSIVHIVGAGDLVQAGPLAGVGPPVVAGDCLAFRAAFVGGRAAVFRRCGSDLAMVARTGDQLVGGVTLAGIGDELAVSPNGLVALSGVLPDGSVRLYVSGTDGTLQEIARNGAVSPAGGTFTSFRLLGLASNGRVALHGTASKGPDGLFYWDGTTLQKLVVVGDGSPVGGSFRQIGLGDMNDHETWAFRAALSDTRGGVFKTSSAPLFPTFSAIALDGDPTPIGGTFQGFPSSLVPAINGGDTIAFRTSIDGNKDFPSAVFTAGPDGTLASPVAVNQPTAIGQLARMREVAIAEDGSIIVRATLGGGTPGLFRAQPGQVDVLAELGDATDLGAGFRFTDPSGGPNGNGIVFLGTREGILTATPPAAPRLVGLIGDRSPLGGTFATFDPPSAGGSLTVLGANVQRGKAGEALFAVRRARMIPLVRIGARVGKHNAIIDFFSNSLDDLTRAGAGPGGVAFQAAVATGGTGVFFRSGSAVRTLARSGQPEPGGGKYQTFGTPSAGRGGTVVFVADGTQGGVLVLVRGAGAAAVAHADDQTKTRLGGHFTDFDQPATDGRLVAFHATMNQPPEGIFAARGRCIMAVAGAGEPEPGGGRFKDFGPPAISAGEVAFRADLLGGTATTALYRATPSSTCIPDAPPLEVLAASGTASPAGPVYLGFGTPAGNRHGAVAVAVDLSGHGASDGIVLFPE